MVSVCLNFFNYMFMYSFVAALNYDKDTFLYNTLIKPPQPQSSTGWYISI